MLLFRSEEDVDAWCAASGEPRGETVPLAQVWTLAQAWYGDRMDQDFQPRTAAQAVDVFTAMGLTSAFWRMDKPITWKGRSQRRDVDSGPA